LVGLDGRVVHRDVKPENVLYLDGRWCLADFGISRYAEATTAADTRKYALSPPYAAPERWRGERATIAADVYAVGIIAYELLSDSIPYLGPGVEEFREQHLHGEPRPLDYLPASLGALVEERLYKAPEARPSPRNLLARLRRFAASPPPAGLASLQEANRAEVAGAGTRHAVHPEHALTRSGGGPCYRGHEWDGKDRRCTPGSDPDRRASDHGADRRRRWLEPSAGPGGTSIRIAYPS
jgi:eukaryotic-like serine/threonine-protein kinase